MEKKVNVSVKAIEILRDALDLIASGEYDERDVLVQRQDGEWIHPSDIARAALDKYAEKTLK